MATCDDDDDDDDDDGETRGDGGSRAKGCGTREPHAGAGRAEHAARENAAAREAENSGLKPSGGDRAVEAESANVSLIADAEREREETGGEDQTRCGMKMG